MRKLLMVVFLLTTFSSFTTLAKDLNQNRVALDWRGICADKFPSDKDKAEECYEKAISPKGYCLNNSFCYIKKRDNSCVVSDRSYDAAKKASKENLIPSSCEIVPLDEMKDTIFQVKEVELLDFLGVNKIRNETTGRVNANENNRSGERSRNASVEISHTASSDNGRVSSRVDVSHTRSQDSTGGRSNSTSASGSISINW